MQSLTIRNEQFDTGRIDSHADFGINAGEDDRLSYRRVTTCAVLNNTAYTTSWLSLGNSTGTPPTPQLDVAYANYGPSLLQATNWTYAYSNVADFQINFSASSTIPYHLYPQMAYGPASTNSASSFVPIREISQNHSDLILVFLSYAGSYSGPVNDPWFSAHQLQLSNSKAELAIARYEFDRPISSLGCTEQHQFCVDSENCSDLLGFDQVQDNIASIFTLTAKQNVTLDRILRAVTSSGMNLILSEIKEQPEGLAALNRTVTEETTISLPLPDNQWQVELVRWQTIAMAQLQRTMVEYATGQIAASPGYLLPPQSDSEKWLCQNMMIQSAVYQSFSVMALVLIVVFGMILILISLTIETSVGWVQRRFNRGAHGREMWEDHHMLGPQTWRDKFEKDNPEEGRKPSSGARQRKSGPHRDSGNAPRRLAFPELPNEITKDLRRESSESVSSADSTRSSGSHSRVTNSSRLSRLRFWRVGSLISRGSVGRKTYRQKKPGKLLPRGRFRQKRRDSKSIPKILEKSP
jgi:hypothetical protein